MKIFCDLSKQTLNRSFSTLFCKSPRFLQLECKEEEGMVQPFPPDRTYFRQPLFSPLSQRNKSSKTISVTLLCYISRLDLNRTLSERRIDVCTYYMHHHHLVTLKGQCWPMTFCCFLKFSLSPKKHLISAIMLDIFNFSNRIMNQIVSIKMC